MPSPISKMMFLARGDLGAVFKSSAACLLVAQPEKKINRGSKNAPFIVVID
jgi:hypothetical protein